MSHTFGIADRSLSLAFESSPICMALVKEPTFIFERVNKAFEKIAGKTRYISLDWRSVYGRDVDQTILDALERIYREGKPIEIVDHAIKIRGSDEAHGQVRYFRFIFNRIDRSEFGENYAILIQAVDTTELVEAKAKAETAAKELSEIKDRLSSAVEVAGVGFYDWDIVADKFTVSEQFSKDWGVKSGVKISDLFELILEDDLPPTRKLIHEAIQTGQRYRAQYRIRRKTDGQILWIEAQGRTEKNSSGEAVRLIGTTVDISDKKGEESQLLTVANSIPQLAWISDSNGYRHWFNDRWYEYTGTTEDQVRGFGWKQCHDSNRVEAIFENLLSHFRRGEAWEDSYPIRAFDGNSRWFKSRAEPIRDIEGRITKWLGTNTDITSEREAVALLGENEARARQIANALPLIVWTAEPGGRVDWYNDWWYSYLGQPRGTTWDQVENQPMHPDDVAKTIIEWPKAYKNGLPFQMKQRFRRGSDGVYRWHLVRAMPIFDQDGRLTRYIGGNTDIHDAETLLAELASARAQAERASEAKSQFLANMSHEIRTPLGAIMGFAELARHGDVSVDSTESYLDVVHRNSVQVLKIVDDILDLAKVEAGRVLIETIDVDLLTFIADFESLMGFRARENGIQFIATAGTDLPSRVLMDPTRVRQVLTNAVGNAIKFTSKGSVTLHICYVDGLLKFGVTDTGRGITSDQAMQLFQPFVQADSSTTRKYGGTGLGLVLTRKLCQQMGGDFVLERSEIGVGSHFLATVAVSLPPQSTNVRRNRVTFEGDAFARSASTNANTLAGVRVLVVEDSPDNQALLKIILTKHGAAFSLAKNGVEGIAKALELEHDVILMDLQMPILDGHEAAKNLRSRGYKAPIIALTAHAMKEEHDRALRSGFSDYLTKPIDREALITLIRFFTLESGMR